MPSTYKQVAAENTFSDEINIKPKKLNASIKSVGPQFVGTVTIQRKFDSPPEVKNIWFDAAIFTSDGEWNSNEAEYAEYRIGIKTGEYTSGTVDLRIGQD